jgi:hypothetical protein
VTGTRRDPRSPASSGRAANGPQRARTRGPAGPTLPQPGGVASPVTLGHHLEAAAAKAARLQVQVSELAVAGDHKGAFNTSIQGLRAALAGEARRRPADAIALYSYFAEQFVRLVRDIPGYRAEDGEPQ